MAYIGNTQQNQNYVPAIDYFSGNGSTVAFTLSRPVASVAQVQAVIENVPQNPGDAYTVSGNTITFTSAPPSGTNNIYIYYTSPNTQVVQPGQGTVGTIQMADGVTVNFNDGSASAPSITNTGDTNTGMFFPAADTIAFAEGGTESMRLDSSSNVGIGTSSPTEKLAVRTTGINGFSVSGNITSTPASLDAGQLSLISLNSPLSGTTFSAGDNRLMTFGVSSGTGYPYIRGSNLQYYADNNHVFVNAGSERMRIDSSGNLLYRNTTSAVYDTNSAGDVSGFWSAQFSSANNLGKLLLGTANNQGAIVGSAGLNTASRYIIPAYINCFLSTNTAGSETGEMAFLTKPSGGAAAERMRITSNGGISFGSSGTNFGTSGQVLTSNGDASPSWQSTSGIGVGQTWQNPSRALNTTYTNSTGRPIEVAFTPTIPGVVNCSGSMIVDSITVHTWNAFDNASVIPRYGMSMIVPNGSTYRINASGSAIQTWAELR